MARDDRRQQTPEEPTLDPSARQAPVRRSLDPVLVVVHTAGVSDEGGQPTTHSLKREATLGRSTKCTVVLEDDPRVSRHHATIRRSSAGLVVENHSRHGSFLNGMHLASEGGPAERTARLRDGSVLRLGSTLLVYRSLGPDEADAKLPGLVGVSAQTRTLRHEISLFAPTETSILILGETGSGKEIAARALHEASGRGGELVPVNCAAISATLAESLLFGHRKGAFSGADKDRVGFFQQADGGTLFLDEIGELPLEVQAKLLRALDEKTVMRVGDTRAQPIDIRVVAATNRDLRGHVDDGRFRGDLYARLAEVVLHLSPLRERKEDILPLAHHLLPDDAPPLSTALAEALLLYAWPFNVRELAKVLGELAVRGGGHERLELEMVSHRLEEPEPSEQTTAAPLPKSDGALPPSGEAPASRERLLELLQQHRGNVSAVARAVGRSRKQLYRYLEQHEIDPARFRDEHDVGAKEPGGDELS